MSKMQKTAADYEQAALMQLELATEPGRDLPLEKMQTLLAAARVFATLSLAAATKEAAEGRQ